MNNQSNSDKALRWRCRRGMQELDFMLLRYLETAYPEADAMMQSAFARLLQQQDDLLWDWLTGREICTDTQLQQVIKAIREQ
ncbi:MAG: succinate dehydrogenase assembly factor 2 [Gammaproteobacteria bacterium]|nr:succinate dehydrogenase assembly factor 2 [Gammaproteobacteria bacterium]